MQDFLYVDVRAVAVPFSAVEVCLPKRCYGPDQPVEGRVFPLQGGVGHLTGEATRVAVTLQDAAGKDLETATGLVRPSAGSPNLDEDGDACGPGGFAARVRLSEDGKQLEQQPLDAT